MPSKTPPSSPLPNPRSKAQLPCSSVPPLSVPSAEIISPSPALPSSHHESTLKATASCCRLTGTQRSSACTPGCPSACHLPAAPTSSGTARANGVYGTGPSRLVSGPKDGHRQAHDAPQSSTGSQSTPPRHRAERLCARPSAQLLTAAKYSQDHAKTLQV